MKSTIAAFSNVIASVWNLWSLKERDAKKKISNQKNNGQNKALEKQKIKITFVKKEGSKEMAQKLQKNGWCVYIIQLTVSLSSLQETRGDEQKCYCVQRRPQNTHLQIFSLLSPPRFSIYRLSGDGEALYLEYGSYRDIFIYLGVKGWWLMWAELFKVAMSTKSRR